MKNNIVCFIADRHDLYDDRIYWKQAISLANNGFEVHYITIGSETGNGTTKEGIHYLQLKRKAILGQKHLNYLYKLLPFVETEYHQALAYIKKINPKIIHIHDMRVNRIINELKDLKSRPILIYDAREPIDNNYKDYTFKTSKIPKILTNSYADYIQNWEYKKVRNYDYIFCVDDGLYKRFRENVQDVPAELIYNFTNQKKDRKNLSFNERIYDAAYVGGISEIRGAKVVLNCLLDIVKVKPNFKLLFLGKIFDAELQHYFNDFIKKNQLENNIVLKDFVPHQEVASYLNQIKIGLNPLMKIKAHEEIIQIKLFEYMNFGIPIVTSNFGFMQKYVEENDAGLCFETGNSKDLTIKILKILDDSTLWEKLSKNGINAVDTKYNWTKMEEKMIKIYTELLSKQDKK